jgi:hypothetical protein
MDNRREQPRGLQARRPRRCPRPGWA